MQKITPPAALDVLNHLGAEVALLDADGLITYVNDEWRNFSSDNGGNADAYIGASYASLLRSGASAGVASDREVLAVIEGRQAKARVNYICDAPGVRRHFVLTAVSKTRYGKRQTIITHALVSVRELGGRLDHRNEEPGLQSLRRRLIQLVAHQFRTPLTPLRIDARTLLESSTDDTRATIERISRNLRRLDQLVTVGVDMERLESEAEVNLQPRALLDSLELAANYAVAKEQHSEPIKVTKSGPDHTAQIDLAWLGRAVRELVANAVNHGEPPFEVTIEGTAKGATLSVSNSGGVAEQGNWFEALTQGDDSFGIGKGLGLGLAIVNKVAQTHGGKTSAESSESGTIVRIYLPAISGRIAA